MRRGEHPLTERQPDARYTPEFLHRRESGGHCIVVDVERLEGLESAVVEI